jgi:hypothetical protein
MGMKKLLAVLALIGLFMGTAVAPAKAFLTVFPPYQIQVVVLQDGLWRGWSNGLGIDEFADLRSVYTVWLPGVVQNAPPGYLEAYNADTGHISTFQNVDKWVAGNCRVINLTQVSCSGLLKSALYTCPATMDIDTHIRWANNHLGGGWEDGAPWYIVPSVGGKATQPFISFVGRPYFSGQLNGIRLTCSYIAPPVYITH